MKRVKKMVAMATVMTMVFNVAMPIGVLAKENTNEYGVLAKNGATFSGSGQIIGDIVINNGTFKYSNSATKHVTGTAHVAPEVKVDEPAQGYIPIEVSEMDKELYSGLFNTNNYPDENSEYLLHKILISCCLSFSYFKHSFMLLSLSLVFSSKVKKLLEEVVRDLSINSKSFFMLIKLELSSFKSGSSSG